jgi:uncharacterized tellurite resistance protein B-like protein
MTKEEAIVDVLANFCYFDNEVAQSEVIKIETILNNRNIKGDVKKSIQYVIDNQNDEALEQLAHSMAVLNKELSETEKKEFLSDVISLIKADGIIRDVERFKVSLLAANWQINIKEML